MMPTPGFAPQSAKVDATQSRQVVIFELGQVHYGLALESVDEIVRMVALTPAPNTPDWVIGYLNLRGEILPVADMRMRLYQQSSAAILLNTPIMIVREDKWRAGWIVDAVRDITHLPARLADTPTGAGEIITLDGQPLLVIEPAGYIHELHTLAGHSLRSANQ